jgi:hypothetical protein
MKRILLTIISTTLLALVSSTLAIASVTTITSSGGTTSGGPVNAKAVVTTGAGTVMIDLSNLLTASQVVNVAQNLSDFGFTLSGTGFGTVGDANRTYTGRLIDVGTGGAVTTDSQNGIPANYNGWDFSNAGGSSFKLEDLGSSAGPAQLIIGGTSGSNTAYSSANGSIANNGPHNPFLQGDAVFSLSISGVTAATNVTSAFFSFGTSAPGGELCTGCTTVVIQAVPEPRYVSFLLFGGMLLLATIYYRRSASLQ